MLWLCGLLRVRWGVLPRWAARVISDVSSFLLAMRDHIPTDFCRQPRSLTEIDRWKATEFRLFLLHCGPVVLKGILPDTFYKHFLLLFVASTILTDKNLSSKYTDYASMPVACFRMANVRPKRVHGKEFIGIKDPDHIR